MSETELAEQGEVVKAFLLDLLDAFGLDGEVAASTAADEGAVELDVTGDGPRSADRPKGQTLQAIQELSRSVLQRQQPGETHARVRVDVVRVPPAPPGGAGALRPADRRAGQGVRRPEGAGADEPARPQGRPRHRQRDRRRHHDLRGRGRPPPGRDPPGVIGGTARAQGGPRGRLAACSESRALLAPAGAGPDAGLPRPGTRRSSTSTTPRASWRALDGVAGLVVDLGSGGGVPGLVVGVARPDLELVLVDASAKRCRFLEEAVVGARRCRPVPCGGRPGGGPRPRRPARGGRSRAGPQLRPAGRRPPSAPLPSCAVGGRLVVSEPPDAPGSLAVRWPGRRWAWTGTTGAGHPATCRMLRQVTLCPAELSSPRRHPRQAPPVLTPRGS